MERLPVVVVGAGAAGFLAAYASATSGAPTILVDRRHRVGAKILMSGGTRCNVTNERVTECDFNTPSRPFVRLVLKQFSPEQARNFFETHGVALKLEPTGKYFPVSDSARDVLDALLRAVGDAGAVLRRDALVTGVDRDGDAFAVRTSTGTLRACAVILATGGLSYPESGSDGVGYGIAERLGHSIVPTSAALTPLIARPPVHAALAGVTLDAELRVVRRSRVVASRTGSMLFTHTGYSGPVVLDVSRHWDRARREDGATELRASFVPGRGAAELEAYALAEAARAPRRHVANLLTEFVPARLGAAIMKEAGVLDATTLGTLGRVQRRAVIGLLADVKLPVSDVAGFGKAEVTAGGVSLAEVVARSMMSKVVDGLYFAGEILDVDGYIGGFNFQWAWSTGWIAGRSAAARCLARQGSEAVHAT